MMRGREIGIQCQTTEVQAGKGCKRYVRNGIQQTIFFERNSPI
jgi:hypothetical protein